MAENENADELELEEAEDAPEIPEGEEDKTDYKALAIKNAGIAKRNKTKLEKLKLKNAERKGAETQKQKDAEQKGFDYAQKAFLKASQIAPSEYGLVEEVMKATGKSLDDVLESKYFQAELKERREEQASKDAVPTSSKRASNPTRDSVEYWLAKGELPPADQRELRTKVVNARYQAEKSKSHFTKNPVA